MTTPRDGCEMETWPMNAVYFDTTSLPPAELALATWKAGEQNTEVLSIFQRACRPLSPSQVLAYYPVPPGGLTPPLTSIRRAITVLTDAGALVKTDQKRKGIYGRPEYLWKLPEAEQ